MATFRFTAVISPVLAADKAIRDHLALGLILADTGMPAFVLLSAGSRWAKKY